MTIANLHSIYILGLYQQDPKLHTQNAGRKAAIQMAPATSIMSTLMRTPKNQTINFKVYYAEPVPEMPWLLL